MQKLKDCIRHRVDQDRDGLITLDEMRQSLDACGVTLSDAQFCEVVTSSSSCLVNYTQFVEEIFSNDAHKETTDKKTKLSDALSVEEIKKLEMRATDLPEEVAAELGGIDALGHQRRHRLAAADRIVAPILEAYLLTSHVDALTRTVNFTSIDVLHSELSGSLSEQAVDIIIDNLKMQIAVAIARRGQLHIGTGSAGLVPVEEPATAVSSPVKAPLSEAEQLPRPPFLPPTGPLQMAIPPENWAVRHSQFKEIVTYMKNEPIYKRIKDEKGYVNLYDLNDRALIPWTAKSSCSMALLLNPGGLPAKLMFSHAWGEDIEELEEAIDTCIREHGMEGEDPSLWICWLSILQSKASYPSGPGPTIAEQIAVDPFGKVIATHGAGLESMVAVHTTREDMYGRLWCPKELFDAIRCRVPIWMASSSAYRNELLANFRYWRGLSGSDEEAVQLWALAGANTKGLALAVDTERAKCSSAVDERRIRSEIERSEGRYKVLNDVILTLRKKQTLEHMKIALVLDCLRNGGVVCKEAGFTAQDLQLAGLSATELIRARFTPMEGRSAGYTLAELKKAGYALRELKEAGYTMKELRTQGYTLGELEELLKAFTVKELGGAGELKEVGLSGYDLMRAGYTLTELKEEYTLQELKKEYTLNELKEAYTLKELEEAYTLKELKEACTLKEMKNAGYTLAELEIAGYTATELKKAHFDGAEESKLLE